MASLDEKHERKNLCACRDAGQQASSRARTTLLDRDSDSLLDAIAQDRERHLAFLFFRDRLNQRVDVFDLLAVDCCYNVTRFKAAFGRGRVSANFCDKNTLPAFDAEILGKLAGQRLNGDPQTRPHEAPESWKLE